MSGIAWKTEDLKELAELHIQLQKVIKYISLVILNKTSRNFSSPWNKLSNGS